MILTFAVPQLWPLICCKMGWGGFISGRLNHLLQVEIALIFCRGRCGRDHMVVGFITTYAISAMSSNPAHGEMYTIQHYVIRFVSDLRQVGGFLWVLRFPPPIKLIAKI